MIEGIILAASVTDCKQYFGYLGERSKGEEIPEQCMTCSKLLGCMLIKIKTSRTMFEESRKRYYTRANMDSLDKIGRHQRIPPLENLFSW